MKINRITKMVLPAILLASSTSCYAFGLGFSTISGNESWDDNNTSSGKTDHDVSASGFMFDTIVAKDRLFNYRFTYQNEENKQSNGNFKFEGYTISNDFGFGVFKNQWVRLWLGPRFTTTAYDSVTVNGVTRGTDVVGIAYGPVIGVNVNFPQVVSLSVTMGRMFSGGYVGNIDNYTGAGSSIFGDDVDVDITGSFLAISVIFRINDSYK